MPTQLYFKTSQVAVQITIRHIKAIVGENLRQHTGQAALRSIGTGLRCTFMAAQRGPGGMNEHATVADQVMAEQAAEDRVVPGLRQLIVQARVDQANISALDQRPLRHIQQQVFGKGIVQPSTDFADLFLVEVDPRR
ncbi:hypothetical protein D3C81_1286550 [compost metagenome]